MGASTNRGFSCCESALDGWRGGGDGDRRCVVRVGVWRWWRRTIVVIEKSTSGHFRDVGKAGPTPGDEFFFGRQFWNTVRTHKIGSNYGYCVFQNKTVLHCECAFESSSRIASSQAESAEWGTQVQILSPRYSVGAAVESRDRGGVAVVEEQ